MDGRWSSSCISCVACCFLGHDLWWILISCELLPFSRAMQVYLTPHFATAACGLPLNSKTLIHDPFPCSIHFQHGRWIMVIQPCLGILIGRSMDILPVVDGEGMTIPHQEANLTTFQCSMSRTVQTDVPTNVTQCRRYDMNGTYNSTPWMLVKPCKVIRLADLHNLSHNTMIGYWILLAQHIVQLQLWHSKANYDTLRPTL